MKILMVCLGNICRSPLAEGIMQYKALEAGLDWNVESAGTQAYHVGEAPHKLSQKVAKLNGVDICKQKARRFRKEDMLDFDRIFVMDEDNYAEVKYISRELWDESKVEFLLDSSYPGKKIGVPDPWYGNEDGFHKAYEIISKACDEIIRRVKSEE